MVATMIKRIVYHVGDIVKIVSPAVVTRVGYPLSKQDALDTAEKEYNEKIVAFMREVGAAQPDDPLFNSPEYDPCLYGDLLNALAGYWLRQKGYGGKERKIYTEINEQLRNTTGWKVTSKRYVKTGTYCRGGYSGGFDGEPDYDPPYLSNEQTHTLLTLEPPDWRVSLTAVEIEAVNVEKEN